MLSGLHKVLSLVNQEVSCPGSTPRWVRAPSYASQVLSPDAGVPHGPERTGFVSCSVQMPRPTLDLAFLNSTPSFVAVVPVSHLCEPPQIIPTSKWVLLSFVWYGLFFSSSWPGLVLFVANQGTLFNFTTLYTFPTQEYSYL